MLTAEEEFVLSGLKSYKAVKSGDAGATVDHFPPGRPGDIDDDSSEAEHLLAVQRAQAMDIPLALLGRAKFPLSYFSGRGETAIRRNMVQLSSKMRSINDSMRGMLDTARVQAAAASRADYAAVEAISTIIDQTQGVYAPAGAPGYRDFRTETSQHMIEVDIPRGPAQGPYADFRRSLHRGIRDAVRSGDSTPEVPPFPDTLRPDAPRQSTPPARRPRRLEPLTRGKEGEEHPTQGGRKRRGRPQSAPRDRAPEMSHVDQLYWVKKLVTAADNSGHSLPPVLVPRPPGLGPKAHGGPTGVPAPGIDGERVIVGLTHGRGTRREDVEALQGWLYEMLDRMALNVRKRILHGDKGAAPQSVAEVLSRGGQSRHHGKAGTTGETAKGGSFPESAGAEDAPEDVSMEHVADSVLFVYSVAAEELQRQIGTECRERGELLGLLWAQFFTLVELRSGLKHQKDISHAFERLLEEQKARKHAEDLLK